MRTEHDNGGSIEPSPSAAFGRDLKAAFRPPGSVPAHIDRRMFDLARRRLGAVPAISGRARLLRSLVQVGAVSAAAAAIVLLVWAGAQGPGSLIPGLDSYSALPVTVPAAEQTTILHAFALARELQADRRVDERWDVDGDGQVDQRDVDTLARRAVALSKRGDA